MFDGVHIPKESPSSGLQTMLQHLWAHHQRQAPHKVGNINTKRHLTLPDNRFKICKHISTATLINISHNTSFKIHKSYTCPSQVVYLTSALTAPITILWVKPGNPYAIEITFTDKIINDKKSVSPTDEHFSQSDSPYLTSESLSSKETSTACSKDEPLEF